MSYRCDGAGNDYYEIDIKPAGKEGKAWRYAVLGDWNVVPRLAKPQKNAWIVDIDGDGIDDTVRVATRQSKSDDGETTKVLTYTLESKGKKLRVKRAELDGTYAATATLEFADLNGDGVLDFVFTFDGHNTSIDVVDVASGKPEDVAGRYAGD
jgi:hypothetical protein